MRLCRYQHNGNVEIALLVDDGVVSLNRVADELMIKIPTAHSTNILDYLPPSGKSARAALQEGEGVGVEEVALARRDRQARDLHAVVEEAEERDDPALFAGFDVLVRPEAVERSAVNPVGA